jgi:hypothetical protein
MLDRLFTAHPRVLGETYGEHFSVASRFGMTMIRGGLCALIHAAVPAWFETAGSDTIRRLNKIMVDQRRNRSDAAVQLQTVDWVI